MKVGDVKKWLNNELTPYTWQRVLMRLLPSFREEGMYFHTITDEHELSDKLLDLIDKTLKDLYKVNLPRVNTP